MAEFTQQDIQNVLASYDPRNTEAVIPNLDGETFQAVSGHLQEIGATMIAGSWSLRSEPEFLGAEALWVSSLIDKEMKLVLSRVPGSFVGPYVLGHEYIPKAIGIWGIPESS